MKLTPPAQAAVGLALVVAGAWIVHEAYEGRGRRRPFPLRFIPG